MAQVSWAWWVRQLWLGMSLERPTEGTWGCSLWTRVNCWILRRMGGHSLKQWTSGHLLHRWYRRFWQLLQWDPEMAVPTSSGCQDATGLVEEHGNICCRSLYVVDSRKPDGWSTRLETVLSAWCCGRAGGRASDGDEMAERSSCSWCWPWRCALSLQPRVKWSVGRAAEG